VEISNWWHIGARCILMIFKLVETSTDLIKLGLLGKGVIPLLVGLMGWKRASNKLFLRRSCLWSILEREELLWLLHIWIGLDGWLLGVLLLLINNRFLKTSLLWLVSKLHKVMHQPHIGLQLCKVFRLKSPFACLMNWLVIKNKIFYLCLAHLLLNLPLLSGVLKRVETTPN